MRMRLLTKTTVVLGGLVVVVVLGMSIALFDAWHEKRLMDEVISRNVSEMLTAAELDISLLRQQEYLASYIMSNGDKKWLEHIEMLEPLFGAQLDGMTKSAETEEERAILDRMGKAFDNYDAKRNEIVALFENHDPGAARLSYLKESDNSYQRVASACNAIVERNRSDIVDTFVQSQVAIRRLTYIMVGSVLLTALLGAVLIWTLFRDIFLPIRRLTADARLYTDEGEKRLALDGKDDLVNLRYYFRTLMTGLDEARSDLEKSRTRLVHSERLAAIGNAVAHIAHEVRNPLMSIGGFARLIEKRPQDSEKAQQFAGIISQETDRLERMLLEVMEFSKPVGSQRRVQSLNAIVKNAVDIHASQVPDGISVELALDPKTPDVMVDASPIQRIILNLLRNSVEAVGSGGKISISTSPYEGGAMLVVQDNGPGIPEELREQVFEPFFTTKQSGHGLGLAICRQIVNEHGGAIKIDSAPGKGTTFTIRL